MDRTYSSALHRRTRSHCIGLGRVVTVTVTFGLVAVLRISLVVAAAVAAGVAPAFDQSVGLPTQHELRIHLGPSPTCLFIPNPPQHDCRWPGAERSVVSVEYVTPHGTRSLVWFRLP